MSKSKNRTTSLLSVAKNQIRGSTDKRSSIDEIRANSSPDLLYPISYWGSGWLPTIGVLANIRPKYIAKLNSTPLLKPADLKSELAWIDGFLKKSSSQLIEHVELTRLLEDSLLSGDLDIVSSVLPIANSNLGYSMVWTATNVALEQIFNGLESQKAYVSSLKLSGASRNTQFFAYWWSVRAESNTTTQHYIDEILRRLERWDVEDNDDALIRFYLLNQVPASGSEVNLLSVASSSTSIDAYEMLLAICEIAVAERRAILPQLQPLIKKLSRITNDPRLFKILLAMGTSTALARIPIPNIYVRDKLLKGLAISPSLGSVTGLSELAAACFHCKINIGNKSNFLIDMAESLSDLKAMGRDNSDAIESLSKIGLTLGHIPLGRWTAGLVSCHTVNISPFSQPHQVAMFINAEDSIFEASSALDGTALNEFYTHILTGVRNPVLAEALHALQSGFDESNRPILISRESELHFDLQRLVQQRLTQPIISKSFELERYNLCRELVFARFTAYLDAGENHKALIESVNMIADDERLIMWLPARRLLEQVYSEEGNMFPSAIQTPVYLHLYERLIDDSIFSFTAFAAEDYVLQLGADRPTELSQEWLVSNNQLSQLFLHKVCSFSKLKFFTTFESERDLETERIQICLWLSEHIGDVDHEHTEEARKIITTRLVKEAEKQLHASKISIDSSAIRDWANKNLREEYSRYQEFHKKGLVPVGEEFRSILFDSLKSGTLSPELFEVPENESITLLGEIISRYMNQCVNDSEHGLDCYLSLRIRHGTLSGLLRSAAEKEHVVTRKTSQLGNYLENVHWRDRMIQAVGSTEWQNINDRLGQFSAEIDHLIENITAQRIQIHRNEKPDGLFKISLKPLEVVGIATDITGSTTFDEFVGIANELFWFLVEKNLQSVREYINVEFRSLVSARFDELEADFRQNDRLTQLADRVLSAKNETSLAIDQIRDWFVLPATSSTLEFTLKEMVAVSLESLQRFHRDFKPRLEFKSEDLPPFQSALNFFTDIFFIVFENIYLHGGMTEPCITISFSLSGSNLKMQISNPIDETLDIHEVKRKIDVACFQLSSDDFVTAVRKERGTGLAKIANLIGVRTGKGEINATVDEETRLFTIDIDIETVVFNSKDEGI